MKSAKSTENGPSQGILRIVPVVMYVAYYNEENLSKNKDSNITLNYISAQHLITSLW